jgi:DNA methylase
MSAAAETLVTDERSGEGWRAWNADCVDVCRGLPDSSVHFTVFSPPFASLYTYGSSDRDMGNVKDGAEFASHFAFLVPELLRVTKPGRLLSMHCMNLPTSKARDGHIGISDFRGELIRTFVAAGWFYHSEVCIWKDPVTAMQRTKALGLLHKQIEKDSCMSRQGLPDYLVTFRKPGDNAEPVAGRFEEFVGATDRETFETQCQQAWHATDKRMPYEQFRSVNIWQRYASPVWMDINPSDTLQYMSAREEKDERHICPLQLQVIERALELWTNPGDVVLSPFGGIGSEGHVALKMGRKFIAAELKRSYYEQMCRNLQAATAQSVMDFGVTP